MRLLVRNLLVVIGVGALLNSCSTDVQLNGTYKDTPIVYGILDPSVDTQYVKINKSFMGEGNNYQYAKNSDSLLYKNISAKVSEFDVYGKETRSWPLQEIWIKNLEQGVFYGDSQKVYYFVEPKLDSSKRYDLQIKLNKGLSNEKTVSASTTIPKPASLGSHGLPSQLNGSSGVRFHNGEVLLNPKCKIVNTGDGFLFELFIEFFYDEVIGSQVTPKTIRWKESEFEFEELNNNEIESNIKAAVFYNRIKTGVSDNPAVDKRIIRGLAAGITTANEQLREYLAVSRPDNSIASESPASTNISGGRGLFAARNTKKYVGKAPLGLHIKSFRYLVESNETKHLKFCSDDATAVGGVTSNLYCN